MKPLLAMVAAVGLVASCGPESFDQHLERDARADIGPVADRASVGDAMDAGNAPDVRDATASDGPCTTVFPGDLLYTFDTGTSVFTGPAPSQSALPAAQWFSYGEPAGSAGLQQSTTGWSSTEGHSCPGSLTMTANFTVYGSAEKVLALINFNANWAVPKAYQHLHAWVKIMVPSTGTIDHLDGIQLAANTNNYNAFLGVTVPASGFADGNWHEIVLNLVPGSNYVPDIINQSGVQLIAKGAAPPSMAVPVPTAIFIDDIWLEGP
jgi:hypothetical protein